MQLTLLPRLLLLLYLYIYWKKNVDCTNHRRSRFCEESPSQNMKHHIMPFSPDKEPVVSEDRLIRQCHSSMSIQVRCPRNEYHEVNRFSKDPKEFSTV